MTRFPAILIALFLFIGCEETDDAAAHVTTSQPDADAAAIDAPAVDEPAVDELADEETVFPAAPLEFKPSHPSAAYSVTYAMDEHDVLPTNEPFDMLVRVTGPEGASLDDAHTLIVDGAMPHHGHGLVRLPKMSRIDATTWRVEGLLLHMPGRWEIYFDVTHDGITERTQHVEVLQ